MSGEIEVTAEGHLAADAVVKSTSSGRELVELRLAVGVRKLLEGGTWEDVRTDWVDVAAWGWLVPSLSQLRKGERVIVRGKLVPGAYLTKGGEAANGDSITARTVSVVPKAPADAKLAPRVPAHA